MSSERTPIYRIPTQTMLFHLDSEELKNNFPEWYERRFEDKPIDGQDFNALYAATSSEIDMDYDEEAVNLSFGPLIETVKNHVTQLQGSSLLEIGGASGLLARNLQDKGVKITLLETQKNFVQKAKERGVVDTRIYDGFNLGRVVLPNEKFDAVIACRVFEEIVMPENTVRVIMRQINNVLKPNGFLIVGTRRKEAVWYQAIKSGLGGDLLERVDFNEALYIRSVCVYGKTK